MRLIALVLVFASITLAQQAPPDVTKEARDAFGGRDYAAAAAGYRKVVAAYPKDGEAWYRLGYALHVQGELDEALKAHLKGAALESPYREVAAFNVACVHALQGRKDDAFAWLDKAIGLGFHRVGHAKADDDLASLRDDPRFEPMLRRMEHGVAGRRRNVAIFIHDGVELLDFAGPGEVFAAARSARGERFRVYTVGPSKEPITSQGFLTVTPQYAFEDCPQPDVIVLPGGSTGRAMRETEVVDWVKRAAPKAEIVMSVCTGAFIMHEAGLLENAFATTHRSALDGLAARARTTEIRREARVVDNGKMITTAGISAGIDGSLHVVSRLLGPATAERAAYGMQYRWKPEELALFVGKGRTPKPTGGPKVPKLAVKGGPVWMCPPCDNPCDEIEFGEPGKCPHCFMTLEKRK